MPHMAASSVKATLPVLGAGRMPAKGKSLPQRARPQQGHLAARASAGPVQYTLSRTKKGSEKGERKAKLPALPAGGAGTCGGGSLRQLAQEVDHLDGGEGGLGALVAGLGPGPVDRLLQRVAG